MMFRTIGLVLGLMMAGAMMAAPALAQDGPATIGIVNLDKVRSEAAAVSSLREQIDGLAVDFQAEIADEENALRQLDQELQQQRALVAQDVWQQQRGEFEERAAALQRKVEGVRRTLDGAADATMAQISAVVLEEIRKLAEERGIDVVLNNNQVVLARNVFDMTEEVLTRLNARLPSVEITATESAN